MKTQTLLRDFTALAFSLLVFLGTGGVLLAQDLEGGAARKDLSGGAGRTSTVSGGVGTTRRPRPSGGAGVRNSGGGGGGGIRTVTKLVTPTTGAISISAEPNADLYVTPISIPGQGSVDDTVPADERGLSFPNLKPGRYKVRAELDGYTPDEKVVTVQKNDIANVTLNLRPVTYNVTISANVQTGEVRFAPIVESGTDASGNKIYSQAGVSSVVNIVGGRATLPPLRAGTYGVDIRTDEVGYAKLLGRFSLPGDTNIPVTLEKKLSEKTISANWDTFRSLWENTGNWNSATSGLTVSGPGMAIPRNDDYRHYADFELMSDVKLLNGVAASFVVHATDPRNYYLVQLTGPNADEPYVLRGFIVRNGQAQRFGEPQSIRIFSSTLSSKAPFTVFLKMTGNRIEVQIQDNESGGGLQPAGVLIDPNSQLRVGAVGIGAQGNEQFAVNSFMVCKQCPR